MTTYTNKRNRTFILLAILIGLVFCMMSITFYITQKDAQLQTPSADDMSPTPPFYKAFVTRPDYCYNGPGEYYQSAAIVPAGLEVDVLGKNSDMGDWFMVQQNSISRCWINKSVLNYNIDIDKILTLLTAITATSTPCYTGPGLEYPVRTYIPQNWRIVIYAKNDLRAEWVLVTPHDSTEQCWVAKSLLTEFDPSNLLVVPAPSLPPSPTIEPTITLTNTIPTDPSQIKMQWRILSYDCGNAGKAIGVLIGLDVSGGVAPYKYSREFPAYAKPGDVVSVTVNSGTSNGEPSNTIRITVPNASDTSVFKCDRQGPGPTPIRPTSVPPTPKPPTSIPPTPVPPTPKPPKPTPTLCWPPGHCK